MLVQSEVGQLQEQLQAEVKRLQGQLQQARAEEEEAQEQRHAAKLQLSKVRRLDPGTLTELTAIVCLLQSSKLTVGIGV